MSESNTSGPSLSLQAVDEAVSPFLQVFWDLSAVDIKVRENAAEQLLKHLKKQTPDNQDGFPRWSVDMVYTIKRLCRGICSSHDCARQGFSLALTYPLDRLARRLNGELLLAVL